MTEINPYQAPSANVTDIQSDEGEMASRLDRFFAAMIDGVLACMYAIPLMIYMGLWESIKTGQSVSALQMLPYSAACLVIYVLLHGYFLHKNGQSIGKRLFGIRIVTLDDQKASLSRILLIRFLPLSLLALIPGVGNILVMIDSLFIFRKDRRCLHDKWAGTKVVDC